LCAEERGQLGKNAPVARKKFFTREKFPKNPAFKASPISVPSSQEHLAFLPFVHE